VASADRSADSSPPPPAADIFAVYPESANLSAKVSAFIDFLTEWFGKAAPWPGERR
jgi:LysR family transcriptional activator of dmlA